jgi:hypothetical protein
MYIRCLEKCHVVSMCCISVSCQFYNITIRTTHHFPNMPSLWSFLNFHSNWSLCIKWPFQPPNVYTFFKIYLKYQFSPWNFHLKYLSFSEFKKIHLLSLPVFIIRIIHILAILDLYIRWYSAVLLCSSIDDFTAILECFIMLLHFICLWL